jgi:hypothetical protein
MKTRELFLLFSIYLSLMIPSGIAQPKKLSKETQAKVDALQSEAKGYFNVQNYERTLDGLREAYRLSNDPKFQLLLGQTYRKMKRYEDALSAFQIYLKEGSDTYRKSELTEEIIPAIEELLKQGSVSISSNREQVEVYIDDIKRGSVASAPLIVPELIPGQHTIELKKEGFATYQSTFTLGIREALLLKAPLEPLPGTLHVTTNPERADILINGKTPERLPLSLPPGKHQVSVVKKGFQRYNTEVVINPGAESLVQATLEVAKGTIEVFSNVPGAEVLLDGKKVGVIAKEGTFSVTGVPVGEHEVTVSQRRFQDFQQRFILSEDSAQKLRANLPSVVGPKIAYGIGIGTGIEGLGLGVISLSLLQKIKPRNPPLFEDEVQNTQTQLRAEQGLIGA